MTSIFKPIKSFGWIVLTIWLLQTIAFSADIDSVTGLHSMTHVSHQSSNITQIIVVWDPPLTGEHNITGYYYRFDSVPDHVFTMDNTSGAAAEYIQKSAPRQAVSPDYSGFDDRPFYCHVAAVDEMNEIMGPTLTSGPYLIDDIPPYPATVIAPTITSDAVITLLMGAQRATEMNISSHAYCRGVWETFQSTKTWNLDDFVGTQILFVCFRDPAGNISQTQTSIWYDGVLPTVSLSAPLTQTVSPNAIPLTVTFSEGITGFDENDLVLQNTRVSNFSFETDSNGFASVFTLWVQPIDQGFMSISVPATVAKDLAKNGNYPSAPLIILYDTVPPTVKITSPVSAITNQRPISITVQFSEVVKNFTDSDIVIQNGLINQFQGVGNSSPYSLYTFNLYPSNEDYFSVQIPANCLVDIPGNKNMASSKLEFLYDITPPTAVIQTSASEGTISSPIAVTIIFDELSRLTSKEAIQLTNGTMTNLTTNSNSKYYTRLFFNVTPKENLDVILSLSPDAFVDQAGTPNVITVTTIIPFEGPNPTVLVGSNTSSPTYLTEIPIWVTFNKDVEGFDQTDILISNAHVEQFSAVSQNRYEMQIVFDSPGTTVVTIPAGAAQDLSGNQCFGSAPFQAIYQPNTPHVLGEISAALCVEDQFSAAIPVSLSDAEGGAYSLFVQSTSDLFPVDADHITICVAGSCRSLAYTGLVLTANEMKMISLFVRPGLNANGAASLTVSVSDRLYTLSQSFTVTIEAINDPPVIVIPEQTILYTENDSPRAVASGASVTDIDSVNFSGGQLVVDFVNPHTDNHLGIKTQGTDPGMISATLSDVFWGNERMGSYSGGNGDIPLIVNFDNPLATPASVSALVQCITYENTSERPIDGTIQVRIQVSDGDNGSALPQTNNITIIPVNDAPEVILSTTPVAYTENQTPVVVTPYAQVKDLDAINFQSSVLLVAITANGTLSDRLALQNQGNNKGEISVTGTDVKYEGMRIGLWSGGRGYAEPLKVVFNDLATTISIAKVIKAVTYHTESDIPSVAERTITFWLTEPDGTGTGPLIRKMPVTSDNDPPQHHAPDILELKEDELLVMTGSNGIYVTDPDVLDNQLRMTINVDNGTFSLGNTSDLFFITGDGFRDVIVSFTGKLEQVNQALDGLTFFPSENFFGTTGITFRTNDQGFSGSNGIPKSDTDSVLIQVTEVPDSPQISDPGIIQFPEDSSKSIALHLIDVDGGLISIAVSSLYTSLVPADQIVLTGTGLGGDPTTYTILTESGTSYPLSLNIVPASNQYGEADIQLILTDATGMSFTRIVQLSITSVNDMPTITTIPLQTCIEDTVTAPISFTASDLESAPEALSFSVQTSDPVRVPWETIEIQGQGANRSLTILPALDAVGTVQITVTVQDEHQGIAATTFMLDIVPVNDLPKIYLPTPVAGTEDTLAVIPFALTDIDGDKISIYTVSTDDSLVPDENVVILGKGLTKIGESYNVQTLPGIPLLLTLTANPLHDKNGKVTIAVTFTDAGGIPVLAKCLLDITPVNDPPNIIAIETQTTHEDLMTFPIGIQLSDIDNLLNDLTVTSWSMSPTLVADENIIIEGKGLATKLSITPLKDQNGMAKIAVMVQDPAGLTASTLFDLTILPVNDPPVVSPVDDQMTAINIPLDLIPFTINDLETPANQLTVTVQTSIALDVNLSGTDTNRWLQIVNPETYEGLVFVTITVTDAENLKSTSSFNLTITEFNEPPMIDLIPDQTIQEDTVLDNLTFNISDNQSPASDLKVFVESTDDRLVPQQNITISGTGAMKTLRIAPVRNRSGVVLIFITVSDVYGLKTSTEFKLTVLPDNDQPLLSLISPGVCGDRFSLLNDLSGQAFAFGLNDVGQLGTGSHLNQVRPVPLLSDIYRLSAGENHAAAITVDGHVMIWGSNDFSQLGIENILYADTPQALTSLSNIHSLALGSRHSLALDTSGRLWAWGNNYFGQAGTGSQANHSIPALITHDGTNQPLNTIIAITTGFFHSIALDDIGSVWAWGRNDFGQLGDGSFALHHQPMPVKNADGSNFQGVVAIASGSNFVLALTNDGDVWAWGDNTSGQLATGSTGVETSLTYPTRVNIPVPCQAIAAGDQHALALTRDGHVLAWGANTYGQLGIGSQLSTTTPTSVILEDESLLANVQAIAAGDEHSMAILADGHVMTWGKNSEGQLGDGTPTDREYPVPVQGDDPDGLVNVFVIQEDHSSVPFAWMSADAETESHNLTATSHVSDLSMISMDGIAITVVNTESHLVITPLPDAQGNAEFCFSVADTEHLSVTSCMSLKILDINDPPVISSIPDQTTSENDRLGPITFTISDLESSPDDLTVTGLSLNTDNVKNEDISIVGTGGSRLLFITTRKGAFGLVNIVLTVNDPQGLTQAVEFLLNINDRPDIIAPSIIHIQEDQPHVLEFDIIDTESQACAITPVFFSSDATLIDASTIIYACENNHYSATVLSQTNQSGACLLTLWVTDGMAEMSVSLTAIVYPVNDPPEIQLAEQSLTYTENITALQILADATLLDVDSLNFDLGRLTIQWLENSEEKDHLFIKNSDEAGQIQVVELSGNQSVFYGGIPLGTISGGQTGYTPLVIYLGSNVSKVAMSALIQQIAYTHESDTPQTSDRLLSVVLAEGDHTVGPPTQLTLSVVAINDDPALWLGNTAISGSLDLSPMFEQQQLIFDTTHMGQLMVKDPDIAGNHLFVSIHAEKGLLIINPAHEDQLSNFSGNAKSDMTFDAPINVINAALNGMTYTALPEQQGNVIIEFSLTDKGFSGLGGGDTQIFQLNTLILSDNDAPEIEQLPDQYVNEDTTIRIPFSLTDVDGDDLLFTIVSQAPDIIQADRIHLEGEAVIGSEGNQYTINIGVKASVKLTLVCPPESDQSGDVPIVLTARDPELLTSVHRFIIHVLPVNDPPSLGGIFSSITYSENDSQTSFCKGITLWDPDNPEMLQAVVSIQTNYQSGDRLSYALTENIIATSNGQSVTFLGAASLNEYESVLDSLAFDHTGDDPNASTRSIVVYANDGMANSTSLTRTIHVTAVNDRPTLWMDTVKITEFYTLPAILEEGQYRFNDEENFLEIRDPDVRDGIMTIRISADKGLLTLNSGSIDQLTLVQGKFQNFNAVVFQGTLPNINEALNGMYYWASQNQLGEAHIVVQMNDNGFSGDGAGVDIIRMVSFIIQEVNDPPSIAYINGKVTLEDTAISIPIALSDPEGDPLTIWPESSNSVLVNPSNIIFSGDQVLFVNKNKYIIDMTGGYAMLTATITPSKDRYGQTQLTIQATDGELTGTRGFSFNVLAVNDPPEFLQIPATSFPEGLTEYVLDFNPYVLDIDNPDNELSWTASSNYLEISINQGILTMKAPYPDFYGDDLIFLKASDPEGLFVTSTVNIYITPLEDMPVITEIDNQVISMGSDIPILLFSVYDAEGGPLTIVVTSFEKTLIPNNDTALRINNDGMIYSIMATPGKYTELSLNILPTPGMTGASKICVQVVDVTGLTDTTCFNVHIAPYLISAFSGRHGYCEPEGVIAVDTTGSYLPVYFTPEPGYQVDMLIVDGKFVGAVTEYIFFNIVANHELMVTFRPADSFTLSESTGDGGHIDPSGSQTVYSGDTHVYSIVPDTGYTIADVRVDDVSVGVKNQYTFENIHANHEITAIFKAVTPPTAQFNATPVTGYAPLTVQLNNQSSGEIRTYQWNFGDGAASILQSPIHTYAVPGNYSVSLTVSGPGGTDILVKENWMIVQKNPVKIDFHGDQRSGVAPLIVQFIENTTETIFSRKWDFGDGKTSNLQNPAHTFAEPGTYGVTLTVTAAGGTRSIQKPYYIEVLGRQMTGQVTGGDIGNQGIMGYGVEVRKDNILVGEATTDVHGYYTIDYLPAYDHLIVSAWPTYGSTQYFYQYYNQKKTHDQATPVSTVSDDANGINFILERAPNNGISGKVVQQSGVPEDQAYVVEIWSESTGFGHSITVDANGRYTLTGLREASDYRVYVWSESLQQFFYYYIPQGETSGAYVPNSSASAWQAATRITPQIPMISNINIIVYSAPFIRGQVMLDGKPLANQWVNAWSGVLQTGFGAFTNAQGTYEIVGLVANHNGSPLNYLIEIQDSPWPYQVYDNQTQRENATPVYVNTDHVDFNLKSGASISGTVKDSNGLPLYQVTVSATSKETGSRGTAVTDAKGAYVINGLSPSNDYIVAVYPIYYPVTFYSGKRTKNTANRVSVSGEGAKNINFILKKGALIRGYLFVDTSEQVAPSGIWVNIWSESTQTGGDVPTDSTGRYEITGLDPLATDYIISVIHPDYVPSFYSQDAANQTVHAWSDAKGVQASVTIQRNLMLTQGGQLTGLVSFDDSPIDGVYIEAWSTDIQAWRSVLSSEEMDINGANYQIQGVLPGTYQVRFSHPLYIDVSKAVTLSANSNILNMVLEKPDRQISGTITGLQIGTKITLMAWSVTMNTSQIIHLSGNGSPISYRFDALKPGEDYRVELRSSSYPSMVYDGAIHWANARLIDISNSNASGIDFDLPELGQAVISGNIILPEVPGKEMSIWIDAYSDRLNVGKGMEIKATSLSGQQIAYQLQGLVPSDDYIVGIWSTVYQDIFFDQASNRSQATPVDTSVVIHQTGIDFILSTGGKLSGKVVDAQEEPVFGIIIEVYSQGKDVHYCTVTDDFGNFQINGVINATDYILETHYSGEPTQFFAGESMMTIDSDKAVPITIDDTHMSVVLSLQRIQTGWIQGQVTDETGKPITGIWVSAWSETEQTGSSVHTDTDGQFSISGLPPALDFEVTAQSVNGAYIDQTHNAIPVNSTNIVFVLTRGFELNGTLIDESGNSVEKAEVILFSSQSNLYRSVRSASDGSFTLQGLKSSNDYILQVTPQASSDLAIFYEKGIQLSNGQTRTIVLSDGIRIQGNIQVKDQASGAWINYKKSVTLSVYSAENDFLVSGQSTSTGTYAITTIPQVSSMILRVAENGYALLEMAINVQSQTNDLDIRLISAANIQGCIKDDSGRLVEKARIMVRSTDAQLAISGISDAQGCYDISGLLETVQGRTISDYEINVQADGYIAQSKGGKRAFDTVHFTLHQSTPHIITGRIMDKFRNIPLESVSIVVKLFEKDLSGGYLGKTQIDDNGYFSFEGLVSDTIYHIQCIFQKTGTDTMNQWAADDDGIGRVGATDYQAGDDVEFVIDTVWGE
ncbi:MAG: carboxypeptidase regulatory-like domain-containing protein [Candidatus Magnetomorum sp.]|nr:carboxypeptidase regulatory-like domain-containing protein [Candidatus Magnetomorum sp.]